MTRTHRRGTSAVQPSLLRRTGFSKAELTGQARLAIAHEEGLGPRAPGATAPRGGEVRGLGSGVGREARDYSSPSGPEDEPRGAESPARFVLGQASRAQPRVGWTLLSLVVLAQLRGAAGGGCTSAAWLGACSGARRGLTAAGTVARSSASPQVMPAPSSASPQVMPAPSSASPQATPARSRETSTFVARAREAVAAWFEASRGLPLDGADWWHLPNLYETALDAAELFPEHKQSALENVRRSFRENGCFDFINPYFDDTAWWGRLWSRMALATGEKKYLRAAERVFDHLIRKGWNTKTCGGGMLWSKASGYKNAITVELMFSVATRLHAAKVAAGEDGSRALEWARGAWGWLRDSGMIAPEGFVNDGLDADCTNNGGPPWTYNQGVILEALANLFVIERDPELLDRAHAIAAANFEPNVRDGVLVEAACGDGDCAPDGQHFKGIFVRGLRRLLEVTPAEDPRRPRLVELIERSADAAWAHRNADGTFGAHWHRTSPSPRPASAQASGLDVVLAAAALSR